MRWMLVLLSFLFLTACADKPLTMYQRGNEAFAARDYHASFKYYLYAANQHVLSAQYAVAYQYYYGLGTKVNEEKTIRWLRRAAKRHLLEAQYALQNIEDHLPGQPWQVCYTPLKRTMCHP